MLRLSNRHPATQAAVLIFLYDHNVHLPIRSTGAVLRGSICDPHTVDSDCLLTRSTDIGHRPTGCSARTLPGRLPTS